MSTKSRVCLSVSEKKKIIRAVEDGARKTDVAKQFGILPSTLSNILKKKEEIAGLQDGVGERKIMRNEILRRSMGMQTSPRQTLETETSRLMQQLLADLPKDTYDCNATANVPFYNLPPLIGYVGHDVTKPKAPAARILGRARGVGLFDESPGPGAYNAEGTTRFGPATSLKAKLCSRPRDLTLEKEVPGPGAYFPKFTLVLPSLPKPKLLGRPRNIRHDEDTPGPGNYGAEPAMGTKLPRLPNARAASIKSRPRPLGYYADTGPGPGKYTYDLNKFLKKTPAAPLGGRGVDMIKNIGGPGPDAYFPKTNSFKPRAPAFSFGNRQSRCMTVVIEEDDNDNFIEYECQ